jgi:uncharacterized protein (DUF4415 family)
MAERRSMANALSPEKVAFLRGENPQPRPSTEEQPPEPKAQRVSPAPAGRERVTVTVRLEPEVVDALSQASAERKLKRLEPYTQQDIIGDALKQWLQNAGFFPDQ